MDDENKRLKEDLNELKKKFSKNQDEKKNSLEASDRQLDYSREIINLKNQINRIQQNKLEETSKLETDIINYSKEIVKLKKKTIESQKKI